MIVTDIIFSINIHEDIDFLIDQIMNIDKNVDLDYIIILNTNDYMYYELKKNKTISLLKNIQINPVKLNKKRFHGSLTEGIYSNMELAIDMYNFKYFIVLSSRNLFYNKMDKKNYNNLFKISGGFELKNMNSKEFVSSLHNRKWKRWPNLLETDLSKYIINNKQKFSCCPHEGITFDYLSCKEIINFLTKNNDIKNNLFNWNNCVEEFALQTICINLTGYYYYIGNGWDTDYNISELPKNKYIYKTMRYEMVKRKHKMIKKENDEVIKRGNDEVIKRGNDEIIKRENKKKTRLLKKIVSISLIFILLLLFKSHPNNENKKFEKNNQSSKKI